MQDLKVGDRVILITDHYGDDNTNPVWGGIHGKIIGTVKYLPKYLRKTCDINVEWDNGRDVCYYRETDLALYSEERDKKPAPKNGKVGDRVIYRTTKSGKGDDYTYNFNKLSTIIDVLDVYDETCHPYKVQWDREPGYKEQEIQYCKGSTLVHINRDQKLTIGKTVGLISNVYGDTHNDPIFGGKFGWIQGTIKYYAKEDNCYGIHWDNHDKDHLCWYQAYELVVIERCPTIGEELFEQFNNNKKPLMSSIKDQIKNINRTEPEKTFVEIGFMDDNGDITQDGREALELIQWKNSQNQLKEMADKLIAARNPEPKKRTTK